MHAKTISEKLLVLLELSALVSGNDDFINIGSLTTEECSVLGGILKTDLTGYQRVIDISGIRHSLKGHPDLSPEDFLLIPYIVKHYDQLEAGKKPGTLVYSKVLDSEFFYVECVRSGRKKLAIKTFYKRKVRPGKTGKRT